MLVTIPLPICNVYLLKGKKPILIDTGRPGDAAAIERGLQVHGVALTDLSLLLHTHGHWDHCGSTSVLRTRTDAPVAIHEADAERMQSGKNGVLKPANLAGLLLRPFLNHPFPETQPDLLLREEIDLSAHGVDARVVFTPGHTAGSISILTGDRDVIVGDLIMGGFLGGRVFPRRPGLHYFCEDLAALRRSIRKTLELSPRMIYPGHGGPLDPDRVRRWMERRWRD